MCRSKCGLPNRSFSAVTDMICLSIKFRWMSPTGLVETFRMTDPLTWCLVHSIGSYLFRWCNAFLHPRGDKQRYSGLHTCIQETVPWQNWIDQQELTNFTCSLFLTGVVKFSLEVQLRTKVFQHHAAVAVLKQMLRKPASVIAVNCKAGYHRTSAFICLLATLLFASRLQSWCPNLD